MPEIEERLTLPREEHQCGFAVGDIVECIMKPEQSWWDNPSKLTLGSMWEVTSIQPYRPDGKTLLTVLNLDTGYQSRWHARRFRIFQEAGSHAKG